MLNIKWDKMNLLHTYQKHNINKSRVELALASGIKEIVTQLNGNRLVQCEDNTAVIIDPNDKFITAFPITHKDYIEVKKAKKTSGKNYIPNMYKTYNFSK